VESPGDLGRVHSPTAKYFDVFYAFKQPYKIHTDVQCTIGLQKSAGIPSSATDVGKTDITGHV